MTNNSVVPKTGITSTSFQVHASAFLVAVAGAVYSAITQLTAAQHWTVGGGAALLALVSTAAKLIHDKGIHVATIAAVGQDVLTAAMPDIKGVAVSLEPTIAAHVKIEVDKLRADVGTELAKIPDEAKIAAVVRAALAGLLNQPGAGGPVAQNPVP